MGKWIVAIGTGICASFSFYMAFLAFRLGDVGVYLFSAFGLLFGIPFMVSCLSLVSPKFPFLKRIHDKITGKPPAIPASVTFVPHWFIMGALIAAGLCVLAAILIPFFFR